VKFLHGIVNCSKAAAGTLKDLAKLFGLAALLLGAFVVLPLVALARLEPAAMMFIGMLFTPSALGISGILLVSGKGERWKGVLPVLAVTVIGAAALIAALVIG
jgi:hypothetical protein